MVKIGRSEPSKSVDKWVGGNGTRSLSSSISEGSQNVKEYIPVALVRRGESLQSVARRVLVISSDMTLADFRCLVCRTLGLGDTYPVRLRVLGARSPQLGGTKMSTLYEEATKESPDLFLYVRH